MSAALALYDFKLGLGCAGLVAVVEERAFPQKVTCLCITPCTPSVLRALLSAADGGAWLCGCGV